MLPPISSVVCCASYSTELEDDANSDLKRDAFPNAISRATVHHRL